MKPKTLATSLLVLAIASSLGDFVQGHGRMLKPTTRSEYCNSGDSRNITQLCSDRDWQYCEFISNQYYYRGKKKTFFFNFADFSIGRFGIFLSWSLRRLWK